MEFKNGQLDRGAMIGGYRIDELISRGGMGVVYRATNVALSRIYALKVLAPELSDDDQFRERFKREIRVAASLHHPHVVGIHYAGEHEGLLFLVMDFVYGTDLSQLLRKSGALEPERAVDMLTQLASALDAAHHKGLVHRDVKPANVLITVHDGEEHVYLTDFGLAKRSDTVHGLTQKGVVVGTVDYMAPEQVTGDVVDARTDIYALGCTFFHMLTGNVPYDRENSVATLFAHVHEPPPPLGAALSDSHPTLGAVTDKAMATEPADRYLSAGDFASAAVAALRGMRDTKPPTVVATGEARPLDTAEPGQWPSTEPGTERGTEPELSPTRPEPAPPAIVATGEPAGPPPASRSSSPAELQSAAARPEPAPAEAAAGADAAHPERSGLKRYRWPALVALLLVGAIAAVVIASTSGGSSPAPAAQRVAAVASPVPTNHVTGAGAATVVLHGNVATVTVDTNGLLDAVHLMHIHGGTGRCPTAAAAQQFRGQSFIGASAGDQVYGGVVTSLTQSGDTSPATHGTSSLFPAGANIRYTRTLTLGPGIAAEIRGGLAVIVVHGIDYNGNGVYDNSLGPAAEASAPALCGALFPAPSAAAGRGGSAGTVYTASLGKSGGSPAQPSASPSLLCHIVGAPTSRPSPAAADSRVPTAA